MQLKLLIFFLLVFLFSSCVTEPDGTGYEKVMSCKINGKIWIPGAAFEDNLGWSAGGNLRLFSTDTGFWGSVEASRVYKDQISYLFIYFKSLKDSGTYELNGSDSVFTSAKFIDENNVTYISKGTSTGFLTLQFDKSKIGHDTSVSNTIIDWMAVKGQFGFDLEDANHNILHVTEGVFDFPHNYLN
jgi:hypothetical protein